MSLERAIANCQLCSRSSGAQKAYCMNNAVEALEIESEYESAVTWLALGREECITCNGKQMKIAKYVKKWTEG